MLTASASRRLLASVSSATPVESSESRTIQKKARARLFETGRLTITGEFLIFTVDATYKKARPGKMREVRVNSFIYAIIAARHERRVLPVFFPQQPPLPARKPEFAPGALQP